jgi:hypothetical protein
MGWNFGREGVGGQPPGCGKVCRPESRNCLADPLEVFISMQYKCRKTSMTERRSVTQRPDGSISVPTTPGGIRLPTCQDNTKSVRTSSFTCCRK